MRKQKWYNTCQGARKDATTYPNFCHVQYVFPISYVRRNSGPGGKRWHSARPFVGDLNVTLARYEVADKNMKSSAQCYTNTIHQRNPVQHNNLDTSDCLPLPWSSQHKQDGQTESDKWNLGHRGRHCHERNEHSREMPQVHKAKIQVIVFQRRYLQTQLQQNV